MILLSGAARTILEYKHVLALVESRSVWVLSQLWTLFARAFSIILFNHVAVIVVDEYIQILLCLYDIVRVFIAQSFLATL